MNHLFKRFRRDITGIIWLATGIFLTLALVSYSPSDPSLNSAGHSGTIENFCGYIGSFLADILYQLFGLTTWIFVLACARLAWHSFTGYDVQWSGLRLLWAGLLVLTSSSLAALYLPETRFFAGHVPAGGVIGLFVSEQMITAFNFWGVAVVLWTAAIVLLVFYTERPLKHLLAWPLGVLGAFRENCTWDGLYQTLTAMSHGIRSCKNMILRWAVRKPKKIQALRASKNSMPEQFFPLEPAHSSSEDLTPQMGPEAKGRRGFTLFKGSANSGQKRRVALRKKVQRRIENWELPKLSLLEDPPVGRQRTDDKEIKQKGQLLVNKFSQFSVRGRVLGVKPGPAVTMFEFKPDVNVKISKITELADDLSLALSSESVRIIAPIPGRDVVGIETSNFVRETVYLKDILASDDFWDEDIKLPLAMGCEADGTQKVVDLRKMPHLLVAGSTGSGKSVFVVSLLTGLLFRHSPKTLRLILIDPKQVDLAAFNDIPHLLMPPIRDPKKSVNALRWAIREMEKRYRSMAKFGARGLESFNEKVEAMSSEALAEHEAINEEFEETRKLDTYYYTPQPYIVIVVEEFGDLMAVDKSNVEQTVVRLAQMARACGIHLILAMQSPRKDVVTGLIKTNIPGRVSFKVASKMDSRIILDESGAERLLSRGDMLFLAPGLSKPSRCHGPWLTDEEINHVSDQWREQGDPDFDPVAMRAIEGSGGGFDLSGIDGGESLEEEFDERYDEILDYVSSLKAVSASLLQRKFRLGYPRAARLIEVFESEGVIGPSNGSKPREVLVSELK